MMDNMSDIQQHPNVEISVKNFGPIAEGTVDLRPLTVFVGPSNTGKTYFSTLVYALHGVFSGFSGSELLVPLKVGWFVEVGRRFLRGFSAEAPHPDTLEILNILEKLPTLGNYFKLSDLPVAIRDRLRAILRDPKKILPETLEDTLQVELKNALGLSALSALVRLTGEPLGPLAVSVKVGADYQDFWRIQVQVSESGLTLARYVNEDMILLPAGETILKDLSGVEEGFKFNFNPNWIKGNRYYLPAARSGIMQSHRTIASSLVKRTTRVGIERFPEVPTLSGVIADFMEKIILYEEDENANGDMSSLAKKLETDVLAGEIRLKPSASGYPDFRYRPQGTKEDMRLSQVSSMVSELAPLVLFLRGGIKPGDTLIIEEPEAHLHPGAQTDMAVTLARLVRAGVRVIVTTHSDWLLEQIGNLILEGELAKQVGETDAPPVFLHKEQVGCWHFRKNGKVEEIPYNRMDGVEPQEYGDISESLYNRSAELHNRLEELRLNNESGDSSGN